MTKNNQKAEFTNSLLAMFIYYVITLLLLPASLVGYVLWIGKAMVIGRGSGVSGTAQGPLSARWLQHRLGIRQDEPSNRLMMVLPGISPLALWLVFGPTIIAYRLTGYLPKTFRYPFEGEVSMQSEAAARQTFFDNIVEQYYSDDIQFVSLGAGFDTRAFRLPKNSRSFEIDTPKTQAIKREMLKKAGIDSAGIFFAAADFEKEDWLVKLTDAGFDIGKPALFLWEGVIMYLNQEAVEDTLHKISTTAKGSIIAFDYMTTEPLVSQAFYWRYARAGTKAAGEPLTFGIDSTPPSRERLAEFLQSCGLSLKEQQTIGNETEGKHAWGGFAVAIVK